MEIRDARASDMASILALNEASVHFLGPLDEARLAELHAQASYHRVSGVADRVDAFLLAFREGATYDSPNYRWFAARYERFVYVDRVVVAQAARGRGVGRLIYEDLFAYARREDVGVVTCEINADPPNPTSHRFHARFGFAEVGTQRVEPAGKLVSLQVAFPEDSSVVRA